MQFVRLKINKLQLKLFIIIALVLCFIPLHGQEKDAMDSLRLLSRVATIKPDICLVPKDTVSLLNIGEVPSRTDNFFDKLAANAEKRRLTRELHNIILHSKHNGKNGDSITTVSSIEPYIPYSGMRIRKIGIKRLEVFGPDINDTSRNTTSWIGRAANTVHIPTKESIIKKNLIFDETDSVDPAEIADNERLLRKLPYIEDAKIIITSVPNTADSVDILVIVKDVWAKAFNIRVEKVFLGRFELWDRNLLGLGHEFQNNVLWNTHESPKTGYEGTYTINNVAGTFFNTKITYYNSFHKESMGWEIERGFYTPNVKYAGGASIFHTRTRTLFKTDTLKFEPIKYNSYDTWAGRSFSLGEDGLKNRHMLTFSARLKREYFLVRPSISRTSYYDFQNKTILLGSVTYSRHNYFESNFIYNFGRTEDIPVGSGIEFTVGHEINEYANRKYGAFKVSAGVFPGNIGYFYGSFQAGSFFSKNWNKEQAVINARANYFTPLFIFKHYKFRQFINVNYTGGFNRFKNEYLVINDRLGLPGFINDSVTGLRRLNVHWEISCFTPWNIYDFRFVMYAFANHSWLSQQGHFSRRPYSGIGVGIRIRNERLVFNTIQLRFALYPRIPGGTKVNNLIMSGETLFNPADFLPQAPQIAPYQ